MEKHEDISRRDAMKVAISLIGGLIGSALGIPAIAYVIGPSIKADQANWIRIGPISTIELGKPALYKSRVTRQNGWTTEEEEVAVYVLTENGRDVLAMSNICTHLGCRARWIPEREQFFCPCHNGVYDKYGSVVSGPPPRPLDEFKTKVEGDDLFIQLPAVKRTG